MRQRATTEAALRMSGVACVRGGRLLFRGVDLALAPGEGALLTGPNGVGKSSLLRLIAGLIPACAGTVERRGALALADDRLALDPDETVRQALGFWARIDRTTPAALDAALDTMALASLGDVPVRMLSTGQRKRASIARVIASGAPLWLLDEPANGLDSASLDLLGMAAAVHLAKGGMILAASHQPLPFDHRTRIDLRAFQPEPA